MAQHEDARPAEVFVYVYDRNGCTASRLEHLGELERLRADPAHRLWLDVQGLDDAATVREVGRVFGIHPLALADAVNTPQRPKADVYEDQLVLVTQMVRANGRKGITVEQLTIIAAADFVITFQDLEHGDVLEPVRTRLHAGHNALCAGGPDYLAYAMVDTVVDGYYPVLEALGERLEIIESEVIERPAPGTLATVHRIRRELLTVRRHLWPQRDALASLTRGDAALVGEATRLHFRDCYDHTVQLIDILETYRELSSSLTDAYISSVSNRLNEIMKVLTVISTIFMPLSFLASLYGMNFEYMPELRLRWAYPAVLGIMAVVATTMLVIFRRRGWLGRPRRRTRRGSSRPSSRGT